MADPVVAQKSPYNVDVETGKDYWWCACGRSSKQPFCDGSHSGTGFTPTQYTATANENIHFCGCKQSGKQPVCDGSHNKL